MKIKLPKYFYGSWLLSLTMLLAVSGTISAQSESQTDAQLEAERMQQQALDLVGTTPANRPMAFPEPYCEIADANDVTVEEITVVEFAATTITNTDTTTVLIDKIAEIIAVTADDTYTLSVQGDTKGDFENKIVAFIDWNQNGILDDAGEIYEIGDLENSTGDDGISASMDITVPSNAVAGQTRVRITKTYFDADSDPIINPCAIEFDPWGMGAFPGYGQALDFTIDVDNGVTTVAGETCDDPLMVTSLPFDDAGNTGDFGNFYSNGDVPAVAPDAVTTGTGSPFYLSGNEVVYAYTPADDEVLNISTTNDDDWIGLWAFTGCPFTSTVGYHTSTSGSTRLIEELPVTSGETYYFVISTWTAPESTDFTIHIEKVGGGGGSAYCIPEGTNSDRYIDNFSTTGGSENISNLGTGFSADGYGDFYSTQTVAQEQGESIDFEADVIGGSAGFRVWVDWNQDGVFDTTEEVAYASSGYETTHTGTITVPADALEGETRMRIVSHWLSTTGDIDPCETGFSYGEFEDYKFIVGEGSGGGGGFACEQVFFDPDQPTGIGFSEGNMVANDITVAAGESFTLQTMTFDVVNLAGEPTEYDLEIFEDNGSGGVGTSTGITHHFDSSNMTFVVNGTFGSYVQYTVTLTLPDIELTADASNDARYWLAIAAELSTTGDYTYWVSSNYTTNPDSFPSWQYNTTDGWFEYLDTDNLTKEGIMTVSGICSDDGGDPGLTYCEPVLDCGDGDMITNVTFQEIDNTTGCSPNGYGDYTNLVATVQPGDTYPISVTVGDGWTSESVSVWIDFDNSGTFDEGEFFYIGTGSDEALTGDIDIPVGLADGEYRMRVRVAAVGEPSATWDMACDEDQFYGETEDYTVEVDGSGGGDPCDAADVPYVQNFDTATPPDMPECTTVVNAGTGNNWKTSTDEYGGFTGTFLEYEYNSSNPANSWFFTQGINLEAGTEYEITYAYGSRASAAFPENLKVAFGDDNDPTAMTEELDEHIGILTGGDKMMNTVAFTVAVSGVYYFGFNAFSDADQWYLYVDDIEIKEAGTIGMEDLPQAVFSYYPNPTSGVVNIEASKDISSLAVFNILGQQVLTTNRLDNAQVDLSTFDTGTYLFRVVFADGSLETFKVLKQ